MSEPQKFGVKVCRERKCIELQKDPKHPDSPEFCQVIGGMPGAMPQCIKEAPPDKFIRRMSGQLNVKYPSPRPGVRNCPKECPYKIEKGAICAFTGETYNAWGVCPCNVLGNDDQENYLKRVLEPTVRTFQKTEASEILRTCHLRQCPDGIGRCKGGTDCPVILLPFKDLKECPLWRIPAKLLPAMDTPAIEPPQKPTTEPAKNTEKKAKAPAEKRKKKEPEDPICEACRTRNKTPVPEHACAWCKEEQATKGRRAWVTSLQLGQVHQGDMKIIGKEIPADSIDLIFTDPAYVKDQYQEAYANLAELALRVLKPNGFLITYAPQTHLDEIMDMLRYTGTWRHGGKLQYFWIIESLNEGQSTAKNHQRNAICLHKPILVFQKAHEDEPLKGSRRCFADVVRGRRQKKFHPWQQSIHDVIGIISRFMDPGEILLDPYAGTGTTLKAANLLGMEWIGTEIDPKTHAIAVRELQQQPVDLRAFGIEATAAECQRETVPEQKDTSKQASIEICKVVKTRKASKEASEALEKFSACLDCEATDDCSTHDPRAGCLDTVKAIQEAQKERDHGTGGGPQDYVQHRCRSCGHHKGRKTFHESCPRLGELLFKGGTKSAKVLMDETAATQCEHWTDDPGGLVCRQEAGGTGHDCLL